MIRLAMQEDLPRIMEIVDGALKVMNENGNEQWNQNYPLVEHYQGDLDNKELFVYEEESLILGAVTISTKAHSEYHLINWSFPNIDALTIKRLVVSLNARKKGVSDKLFDYAELVAKESASIYLKTDTFSKNNAAQKLFKRMGFTFVQDKFVEEKNESLLYFEKHLGNSKT